MRQIGLVLDHGETHRLYTHTHTLSECGRERREKEREREKETERDYGGISDHRLRIQSTYSSCPCLSQRLDLGFRKCKILCEHL